MKRLLFILFSLAALSCTGLDELETSHVTVDVTLHLSVDSALCLDLSDEDDIDTKAVVDPDVNAGVSVQDVIKNFWVVQYDGKDDAAVLVGEPKYYPDMEAFLKPSSEGGADEQIKLVASDYECRVVVIANSFESGMNFPQGSTLADLKKKLRIVSDDVSFLSPDEDDRMLVFSGTTTGMIKEGTPLACTLKRNVAKAKIKIANLSDNVTIDSWQLRSVPSVSYYFTEYDLPEIYPAVGEFTVVDYPLQSKTLSKGDVDEYLVYLPVNKCGIIDAVNNEAYKNNYAPGGATYFQINARSDGRPLAYKFYLGGNMTTDFNILPNVEYSYVFEIKSEGDAEYDSRIEESLLVDFANSNDETANCYVINPAEIDGKLRRFRIPVKRVDEFWGGKGYEDVPENTLGTDGQWQVEILASNFDNSDNRLTFTISEGTGSYDAITAELQYFEFTVKPETRGSVIVGIRKGGGPVLWSWHLWITDYNPNEAFDHVPQSGIYSYEVTGGVVHRYDGSIWKEEYAGRFMMDRNLGALNVTDYADVTGSLYYQFGRKDPIFGSNSYGRSSFGAKKSTEILDASPGDPIATLRYSINHPLDYIVTPSWGAWTSDNKYNPLVPDATVLWLDPYTSTKRYFSLAKAKSIFDPCPPGYCLPKIAVWSDFRAQTAEKPTTNIGPSDYVFRDFEDYNDVTNGKGCRYWPYPSTGAADDIPSSPVFYPASGIIQDANGHVGNMENVYILSANPSNIDNYWMLSTTPYEPRFSRGDIGMNLAAPARCITSRDADSLNP